MHRFASHLTSQQPCEGGEAWEVVTDFTTEWGFEAGSLVGHTYHYTTLDICLNCEVALRKLLVPIKHSILQKWSRLLHKDLLPSKF